MNQSDDLSCGLRRVRVDLYGGEGGPLMAEALRVPARSWANYEFGVTIPGLVLLRFIDLTRVEPHWLLTCKPEEKRPDDSLHLLQFPPVSEPR